MKTSKTIAPKVLILLAVAALGACNTVQGVGRDITSVGSAGEKVIHK